MSVGADTDSKVQALLCAIGLVDADGHVVGTWFSDPVAALRRILSNPAQRAALYQLLDESLPAASASGAGGSADGRWHPLLGDSSSGNIYVVVRDDRVGIAARLNSPAGISPAISASLMMPLVRTVGAFEAIAGTADGPLQLVLDVEFGAATLANALRIIASVTFDGHADLAFQLRGVDLGRGPQTLDIAASRLGQDFAGLVQALLRFAMEDDQIHDDRALNLVAHLFAALGLDGSGALPPFPVEQVFGNPAAARAWLLQVASDPRTLAVWFSHVASLLGGTAPPADAPLTATLASIGSDVHLQFSVALKNGELQFSIGIDVRAAQGAIDGSAVFIAIPVMAGLPVRVMPHALVCLRAPRLGKALVDAPALHVGSIAAGVRFDGHGIVPSCVITDIRIDGIAYDSIDLSSAAAVTQAGSQLLRKALESALGEDGPALPLLALLGLVPPRSDPQSPNAIDLTTLAAKPTRAVADLHRTVLADSVHGWSHLFAEIGSLMGIEDEIGSPMGIEDQVSGTGRDDEPWSLPLAADHALHLHLIAWTDDGAPGAAATRRLRIGLEARARVGDWSTEWRCTVLALELPVAEPAVVGLVGEQRLSITLGAVPMLDTPSGLRIRAAGVTAVASWQPGAPLRFTAGVTGLELDIDDEHIGPLALAFPVASQATTDLGLGGPAGVLWRMLRALARHAALTWGGDGAHALAGLLGFHGETLLELPDPNDLSSIVTRPGVALRAHLARLALDLAEDGRPYAVRALGRLAALLRDEAPAASDGFRDWLDAVVGGAGTFELPWTVSLSDRSGDTAEFVFWLGPDGPPAAWAEALVADLLASRGGSMFGADASRIGGFLAGLVPWLGRVDVANAVYRLDDWLAQGDGVVPLASQLPELPRWRHAPVLQSTHALQPRNPGAIAAIAYQLTQWADDDGGRAVVLVSASFSDHGAWQDLLLEVDPARPPGAHFDLRAGSSPNAVTVVAVHYTVDLDETQADITDRVDQLGRVVDRVIALTGRSQVSLVAHSVNGLTARMLAARRPDDIRGVVTLGTPHRGGAMQPVLDSALADALRESMALMTAASNPTDIDAALGFLRSALDRQAPTVAPDRFSSAPSGIGDMVPGLAIGSLLGGRLQSSLTAALVARLRNAAHGRAQPTHLGMGVRLSLPFPAATPGGMSAQATVRVEVLQSGLSTAAAPPSRSGPRVTAGIVLTRHDGWLVGDGTVSGPSLRAVELSIEMQAVTGGPTRAVLRLLLRDVATRSVHGNQSLGDEGFAEGMELLLPSLQAGNAGSVEASFLALLMALGLVVRDTQSHLRVDGVGVASLATAPSATLLARRDTVLDALADILGDSLVVESASVPVVLSLDRITGELLLRTSTALSLAEGIALSAGVRIDLATMATVPDFRLSVGAIALTLDASTGTVQLEALPWLAPVTIFPLPAPDALRSTFGPLVPRFALSTVLSAVLGARLATPALVGPLDALLAAPGDALRHLDGDACQAILKAVAAAVGVDDTNGLALPGGLHLAAAGQGSRRLTLGGELRLPGGVGLLPQLSLSDDLRGTIGLDAGVVLDVALPGNFGRTSIAFVAGSRGVGLSVTPAGGDAIVLLPVFGGFGPLLENGATLLLPRVLQAIVEALRPIDAPPDGLLGASLALATALGVYADDAQGFETPERSARLAALLQPAYFTDQANLASRLAGLVAGLFGPPPLFTLPLGAISRVADAVVWTGPLPIGAELSVGFGWNAAGTPTMSIGVISLELGPLVIDSVTIGFAGDFEFGLRIRISVGPPFEFLAPVFSLGIDGGSFALQVLPLGEDSSDALAVVLAPTPAFRGRPAAVAMLIERWALPLMGHFAVASFEPVLERAMWTGGPTPRAVLEGAGVVRPGSIPARLKSELPPPAEMLTRAIATLAASVTIPITPELTLSALTQPATGRIGLRVRGRQDFIVGGMDIGLRFGDTPWLRDPDAGVTFWILAPGGGPLPFVFSPGLHAVGLGALLGTPGGEPLIGGPVQVGQAGGYLFFDADFIDAQGRPALSASGFGAAVDLRSARLQISASDGDAFIQKVLPAELQAPFDVAIAVRAGTGVELHGGVGRTTDAIELTFPLGLDLSIVKIDELLLAAYPSQGGARLIGALTGRLDLGPLHVGVRNIGVEAGISASGMKVGFKSPDGYALALDLSAVQGAGAILFDDARQDYSGFVRLAIVDTVDVTALGLLTTRLPGGERGYSLLIIIAADFPPLQLGLGFTLNGLGGLLGINRTAMVDVLRTGLRTGILDAILFPPNPTDNVIALLTAVGTVFPVATGRYVFGPMAKIGWGSPTILTLDLAILLEVPDPIRIIVLGRLTAALPEAQDALVLIHMDALGIIDFGRGELSLDATVHDSRILAFTIAGDMALRLSWGAQPNFLLSIGGFHPHFRAPPNVPKLARLAIVLVDRDEDGVTARVRFQSYLALTSNTAQFGAGVDAYFAALGFEVGGFLSFDALFHFAPFSLEANLSGYVGVKFAGVTLLAVGLSLTLTGPTPWHLMGELKVVIVGVTARLPVDVRIGDDSAPPQQLPSPVDVLALVETALADTRNWQALQPAKSAVGVSIRFATGDDSTNQPKLMLHPLGTLSVRQRVAPLMRRFDRFGSAPVDSGSIYIAMDLWNFDRSSPAGSGVRLAATALVEQFAQAQFLALSDHDKLSSSSFAGWTAGLTTAQVDVARAPEEPLWCAPEFDSIRPGPTARTLSTVALPSLSIGRTLATSSSARAPARRRGASRYFATDTRRREELQ